jgi:hypothetical protein
MATIAETSRIQSQPAAFMGFGFRRNDSFDGNPLQRLESRGAPFGRMGGAKGESG